MPYIPNQYRKEWIDLFAEEVADYPLGTLNYIITKILLATLPESYKDYDSLIGLLECVKLEFYRRKVATYEDKKIEENGDVF